MEEKEEGISFVDQRFLSSRPLDDTNVLEYFSGSPFYDRSCNNEILKMQTQFRGLDQKSKLSSMVGIFYELEGSNDEKTLFVIRKAYNHGDTTETLGMYYIIHGHVYAAPTNYSIYRCRMGNSMWLLSSFIDRMIEKRKFDPFNLLKGKHLRKDMEDSKDLNFMMEIFNDFKKEQMEP
ncbi:RNA polymerase II transcriptional regulation mediator complex component [Encephalitozoon hellem]|nr:RNA polymerase II transcriptional regulation mediator complex component [Encephalitozoon hellem]